MLAACTAPEHPDRYIGQLTPTTVGRTCVRSRGVLQITGKNVFFAPDDGTWVLNGLVTPAGTITADRSGQGSNHQPYETRLEATRTETTIKGTYTTPRCTFDVQLTR